MLSRAAYQLYLADRAVVYTGIDRVKPTTADPVGIIRMIVDRERIANPHEWSFYDLQTSLQNSRMSAGEWDYYILLLRPPKPPPVESGSIPPPQPAPLEVEIGASAEMPDIVGEDFACFIQQTLEPGDLDSADEEDEEIEDD